MYVYSYTGILTPCFVCAGEGMVEGNDVGVPWVLGLQSRSICNTPSWYLGPFYAGRLVNQTSDIRLLLHEPE